MEKNTQKFHKLLHTKRNKKYHQIKCSTLPHLHTQEWTSTSYNSNNKVSNETSIARAIGGWVACTWEQKNDKVSTNDNNEIVVSDQANTSGHGTTTKDEATININETIVVSDKVAPTSDDEIITSDET